MHQICYYKCYCLSVCLFTFDDPCVQAPTIISSFKCTKSVIINAIVCPSFRSSLLFSGRDNDKICIERHIISKPNIFLEPIKMFRQHISRSCDLPLGNKVRCYLNHISASAYANWVLAFLTNTGSLQTKMLN